ncbi:PHOSPHATASE AND ACTIN REGULATOR (PHACTR) [Ceraceosorus bombacis]|uniref:PHOSPHATASE AND ACTIN REGULATOR (PHACTR) n=1 Tax=Ceraceosorus bombacis TaxID=401625 RepID=A0A0P1BE61_9BASI|nr:PHOSPHATASE AND ACTIN REGULATOR (PHACTR) [Ceraceosorus bombacis]
MLALNWTPPPSSPLFDEPSSGSATQDEPRSGSNGPLSSSPNVDSLKQVSHSSSTSSLTAPTSSAQGRGASTSPQPRSYAAAAGDRAPARSASTPVHQQVQGPPASQLGYQMPSVANVHAGFRGPLMPGMPGMPAFGQAPPMGTAPNMGSHPQFAWAQYQQMLAAQAQGRHPAPHDHSGSSNAGSASSVTEDGRRRRTTSGPQRAPPLTYNDTLTQQAYPGVSFGSNAPSHMRNNLPGGTMASSSSHSSVVSSTSNSGSSNAPSSFHPYRRGTNSLPRRPDGAPRSASMRSSDSTTTPDTRKDSFSSVSSSVRGAPATPTAHSTTLAAGAGGKKPSPLSRATKASNGQAEDDDDRGAIYGGSDDETADGRATPVATPSKKGGFGKLRKALSFSNMNDVQQAESSPASTRSPLARRVEPANHQQSSGDTNGSSGSTRSTSPPRTPDNGAPIASSSGASISSKRSGRPPIAGSGEASGKRSLFNRKFNSSSDNLSISSTVSSASVMLRKVGNLGKLARRRSLAGLTNMFNKDRDAGREGIHDDDFGAPSNALDEQPAPKDKKAEKSKKGAPAAASVSHATVELESADMMTPAASYVRQHQLQMRAEAEARAERERIAAAALAAAAEAEARSAKNRSKTTDDAAENRQKMVEREKERLKSKRGWRKKLIGGSSDPTPTPAPTGLETMPYTENEPGDAGARYGSAAAQAGPMAGSSASGYEDSKYDAAYDDEELEPPRLPGMRASGEDSGDEFGETDSLRHWGEGIEQARASAANVKSVRPILKNSLSVNNLQAAAGNNGGGSSPGGFEKPFAGRLRANSYDANQSGLGVGGASGGVPSMSHVSSTPVGTDRIDGVAPRPESPAAGDRSSSDTTPTSRVPPQPLGHHANSSMPTLSLMMSPNGGPTGRSVTAPQKKRILFADQQIFHSTWPAHVYDRRGELATCNRLTPLLAQRIKEELNTYKMEEMAVAPSSRIYTHFFV